MLEVRLLGQFDVRRDGTPIAIPSRPAQSLLAYLILNAGTTHRREKLAGLLWPNSPEETARANLRKELWRLRKALASGRSSEQPYILADDISLAFNSSSDYWLDVSTLDCGAGQQATTDDLVKLLLHYRGELLPGFYDDWAVLERERLQAVFEQEVQRLLGCLKEEQRWTEVLDWGERWIALGQRPEPAYRALMIAYGALGDRSKVAATFQRCAQALQDDLGVEPSELTRALYERLTEGSKPVAQTPPAIPRPVLDTAESLTSSEAPPSSAYAVPPFKGLQYFDETDADLFFGRELLTAKLMGRLREGRFLAVIGASGSGKSSVVRAGLVPALKGGAQLADGPFPAADGTKWHIQVITPTAHPLEALALSLAHSSESTFAYAKVLDDLERDPGGFHGAVQRFTPDGQRLLLIVDQFEELFTLCRDEFEREAFVDNLLTAASAEGAGPVRVVLAVRADFYAHCAQYDDLRQALAEHQEYIGPMSVEELRRAIEEPARRVGWEFEPGLVALILRDVGDEPGGLPLLSHALLETWIRRSGRTLTLKGYTESGGMRGAISHTAESIYQRLLPEQREIARRVFLRLTELGEGTEDTRRRAARRELIVREQDTATVQEVLGILAEARLVTLGEDTVEVAHEALIREWPRLREWLNQDRAGLRLHRQLTEAAQEWERLQRDEGVLYRGVRLAQAAEWAPSPTYSDQLNAVERAFLDASLAERDRQRAEEQARAEREARLERRSRNVLRALVVVLLVATLGAFALTGVALNQSDSAKRSAITTQGLALTSAAQLAASRDNPELGLAFALAANRLNPPVVQAQLGLADLAYASGMQHRFTGHTDAVIAVAFSPDGKTALSGSADQTIILWDVASGKIIRRFVGHEGHLSGVAFSPDGKAALTGEWSGTLILWDVASGEAVRRFQGHTSPVVGIAFRADGKVALSGSYDQTLILWNVETGQILRRLSGQNNPVMTVRMSPDGKTALSGSADGKVFLWDVASGEIIRRFEGHTDTVTGVVFGPDGKSALSSSVDKTIILWDVATGQIIRRFRGHKDAVNTVAFSPNGKTALSASGSGTSFSNVLEDSVILWDVATGLILHRFEGHKGPVYTVAFNPDGHTALSGSADTNMILWGVDSGAEIRRLTGHTSAVNAVAFSPDGKRGISGAADEALILWDTATGESIGSITGPSIVNAVVFSPDGRSILTGTVDGALTLWDADTAQVVRHFAGHTSSVTAVVLSPDGKTALSGSLDRTLILWEMASGQPIRRFVGHTNAVNSVTLSPDGKRALSGSYDRTVILWNVETGQVIRRFPEQAGVVNAVAFSADGKTGIFGTADAVISQWDLDRGAEIRRFIGHTGAVTSIAFSPDGKNVISGSFDKTVFVWDVESGQAIRHFLGHEDRVNAVAFSPDGRTALSGSADKSVRLWRIDSLADLIVWTQAHRAISDLPCDQRVLYDLRPLCDATSATPTPTP